MSESSSLPRALVVRSAGTNCDRELCRAFELAGAAVSLVHLDALTADPSPIERAELIGLPGGFSYGDDIASGRIFAAKVRERLYPSLAAAVERGAPIIGVCNGFQVLVQCGLLPGPAAGEPWPRADAPSPSVALGDNAGGRFIDDWVRVRVEPHTRCVWTMDLDPGADERTMVLPVAHGEGRFVASEATLASLEAGGQVALRYGEDINGSAGRVAGICDAPRRGFGLLPHPERYLQWTHHPSWTRLRAEGPWPPRPVRIGAERTGAERAGAQQGVSEPPGLVMFRSAVRAARALPV